MIKKIAVIGDSTVHGRVDQVKGGWVTQLKLWFEGLNVINGVFNLGIMGNSTRDVYERIKREIEIRKIDLVILSVGVNDIRRIGSYGPLEYSVEESSSYFQKIVEVVKQMDKEIVVLSLFPLDESRTTPYDEDGEYFKKVDQLNLHIKQKEICDQSNIELIDLFDQLDGRDIRSLSYEGLHPNTDGHKFIFDAVQKYLLKQILN